MAKMRCATGTYRTLIVLIIILIVLLAIALFLSFILYKLETDKENRICSSPQCIHTASNALKLMDLSIDPCDDFYNFTCGNFYKSFAIPDEKALISTTSLIQDTRDEQLRIVFEEPIIDDEPRSFKLVKQLYRGCMNLTAIEEIGLTEIREALTKLGGWPVLLGSRWRENDFEWKQATYKFKKEGFNINHLIYFEVWPDQKNRTKKIIYLDEPCLGLYRDYLVEGLDNKLVKVYYEYMVDVAVIFGADKATARRELLESLEFEIKLANISHSTEEYRLDARKVYNPITIRELRRKHPTVPWLDYINNILYPEASVTNNEVVSVSFFEFLSDFEKLISVTPKRVQANYLIWRIVKAAVPYLTEKLRSRSFKYNAVSTGKISELPRWKQCVSTLRNELSTAVGAMYVRRYFDSEAKSDVEDIFINTKTEFEKILQNVDWMDEETRNKALEKLAVMDVHAAYPDELLIDEKLDKYYEGYEVDEKRLWQSIINSNKFYRKLAFSEFRLPYNKTYWVYYGDSSVVNAYYYNTGNRIEVPAGILQGIYYNKDNPKYMNYGGIGNVIGHEITHGFDIQGRLYDKNAKLIDWWDNETVEAYNEKSQCIIDQYDNYTVPEIGMNLNGVLTLSENIADIAGTKESYYAYIQWLEENGEEPHLPGFNEYTNQQMFWISVGLTYCSKLRTEKLKMQVMLDVHSPEKYRLWGSVSNMAEFAEDFQCKPESNMNPTKKCQMW